MITVILITYGSKSISIMNILFIQTGGEHASVSFMCDILKRFEGSKC